MTAQVNVMTPGLELGIDSLESLEAPGFWGTAAGVAGGVIVSGGLVYVGGALALT